MKFWEIYRIVTRRKWLVLGLIAFTLAGIYAGTSREKPYYQATAQLMPSNSALYKPMLPSPSIPGDSGFSGSQLPNLMSLVKSRAVAERTLRACGIKDEPESLLRRIDVGTAENPGARSRNDAGTDIIRITLSDSDPARAIKLTNTLVHVFALFYQEISHQEAYNNRKFLESELVSAKNDLEDSTIQLREFKRKSRITSVADASNSAMADLRLATANRDSARAALAESQAKLADIDSQLRRTGPTRTVQEGTSNTQMVQELNAQLAQLTRQLNDARSKYEDTHPQVVALKESIDQVNGKLKNERGNIQTNVTVIRNPVYDNLLAERSTLAAERNGLAARVGQLNATVERSSADLKPGEDVNLARLENVFATAQTNFTNGQNQLNQARLNENETTGTGAIRIVDEAAKAEGPIGVNKVVYLLLGLMLSLVMGVGVALSLESLDNTIRTNRDVEDLLSLPVTALIPRSLDSSNASLARVVYTDPLSPISEAYRFLRTDFLLSAKAAHAKTIMVATAKPGQGGTCTVANLGISLAQDGKRVVIVDADLRRPSLHRVFKVSNDVGLSNILSNEKDLDDVIFSTEVDNLFIIPAGPNPSNPSELLGSARMAETMRLLAEHADFVLFDTPSAIAFTDAVVLSQVVDGVILVVRAQQVSRGAELQVRNLLNKANAAILGVVLNDVQPEQVDSYYFHSHYYPDIASPRKRLDSTRSEPRSLPSSDEAA